MITEKSFGSLKNGAQVKAFTIQNGAASVVLLEYGCAIQSLVIALANGEKRDIVLGYDDIIGYENGTFGQGAFIGRVANRIKGACFELNDKVYTLEKNSGNNHLHGEFGKKLYKGNIVGDSVVFTGESPDGEDGFPANVTMQIEYSLSQDGALSITYTAKSDADTLINLTNHSYFNLDGHAAGSALSQTLWLNSKYFCEIDDGSCPTGKLLPVIDTPMDFTKAKQIGQDIAADYEQLVMAIGYDHNFVIDKPDNELALCAMAKSTDSKLILEAYTTQPGMQIYSANYMKEYGKGGAKYSPRGAFCIETQHYPCATLYSHFPSTVLKQGEVFKHTTIYKAYEIV